MQMASRPSCTKRNDMLSARSKVELPLGGSGAECAKQGGPGTRLALLPRSAAFLPPKHGEWIREVIRHKRLREQGRDGVEYLLTHTHTHTHIKQDTP